MRRPSLLVACCFAGGIFCQTYLDGHLVGWVVGATLLLVCVLVAYLAKCPSRWVSLGLGLLWGLLGILRAELLNDENGGTHIVRYVQKPVEIMGTVVEEPERREKDVRFLMEVDQVRWEGKVRPASGRILIRFVLAQPVIEYGDRLWLGLVMKRPEPARNPGVFDYQRYLSGKGILVLGTVNKRTQVLKVQREIQWNFWKNGILVIRKVIREAIDRNLTGGPAGLLKGVLLGEKQGIPESVRTAFARSGVNHVLAVSGLHVGLIAGVVFFSVRLCGMGPKTTGLVTIGALWLYALVTNLPPSVIRAATMGSLILMGKMGEREGDAFNSLGVAGWVMLIFRPRDLFDPGFQLSFVATAGILGFYPPIRNWFPDRGQVWEKWVFAPLAVSLAAQVTTTPLVVVYFGQISLVGLAANLVVVPLMGVAIGLGLLTVVAFVVFEPIATVFNGTNWAVLNLGIWVAECMARPGWAAVWVARPPWTAWGIYGCVLLLILPHVWASRLGNRLVLFIFVLANMWVWGGIVNRKPLLEIYVLDVGQGDAIFIRFPNDRTMLVDGGLRAKGLDMGARVLVPFLRSQGIRKVDVVVASHPHADHIGGLVTVLEAFNVGWYLDSGQPYGSWTSRRIQALVSSGSVQAYAVSAGDSLVGLGGVGALVLHPTSEYVSKEEEAPHGLNNGSVVLRLTYQGFAILLTGDIEHETDGSLIAWGDRLKADVLKAAHHGSRTSSTAPFMAAVDPKVVVISCGVRNKFGHPSPEVLHRYTETGLAIFRTDQMGAIRLVIDRRALQVTSWLGRANFVLP